ncbi:hypothetical protein [Desulfocicer niacini]
MITREDGVAGLVSSFSLPHCQVPGNPLGGSEHCCDYAEGIAKALIEPGRGKKGRLGLYDHRWR